MLCLTATLQQNVADFRNETCLKDRVHNHPQHERDVVEDKDAVRDHKRFFTEGEDEDGVTYNRKPRYHMKDYNSTIDSHKLELLLVLDRVPFEDSPPAACSISLLLVVGGASVRAAPEAVYLVDVFADKAQDADVHDHQDGYGEDKCLHQDERLIEDVVSHAGSIQEVHHARGDGVSEPHFSELEERREGKEDAEDPYQGGSCQCCLDSH